MKSKINTFETFIEGESNLFAVAASKAVPRNIGEYYNPLWIYGKTGCGKTHLLHAIGHAVRGQNGPDVLHITARDLVQELVDLILNKASLWGYIEDVEVLLVDNMECLSGCKATQERIANLFLEKVQKGHQIVCASQCPPRKLSVLWKVLHKNGEKALIADIQPPEKALRATFIRQYLEDYSVEMTKGAIQYLTQRLRTIPDIKGVLNTAKFFCERDPRSIDVASVREAIFLGGMDDT